jgi:hypothetical protein
VLQNGICHSSSTATDQTPSPMESKISASSRQMGKPSPFAICARNMGPTPERNRAEYWEPVRRYISDSSFFARIARGSSRYRQ